VLFPLRTSKGTIVTRGYPLEPRPGERVDHPHHVGMWFNYGNVNGIDFWNNSTEVKQDPNHPYGTIYHRQVKRAVSEKDRGELEVEADWVAPDGTRLLREQTQFIFRAGPDTRIIDRITKLTALDKKVVFKDDKEGALGIRVARWLEQPSNEPLIFTDAAGKPTRVPVMENKGVTGLYTSSEGLKGDAVWGTRGRWVMLSGKKDDEMVAIAILDHPKNPGYPTYWHARGYGLFAANPFGQKIFTNGKQEFNFHLEPGQSATLRYRVVIFSGETKPDQVEAQYREFIKQIQ
jgi:hypothetical protein